MISCFFWGLLSKSKAILVDHVFPLRVFVVVLTSGFLSSFFNVL